MENLNKIEDISIVLCGGAGQGIQTIEDLLTKTVKRSGYHVFGTKEYMSRVRGGVNSTSIRVSNVPIKANIEKIDYFFPLNKEATRHTMHQFSAETEIIGDSQFIESSSECTQCNWVEIPFSQYAKEIGGEIYQNIIALGVICGLLGIERNLLHEIISDHFNRMGSDVVDKNIQAVVKGTDIASELIADGSLIQKPIPNTDPTISSNLILDGRSVIGLGAIAGGCNYITWYPMSPSTGIATFLAQHAFDFSMIVDQSEDELSVINKAIGAAYAGARSLVITADGGFCLMVEGLSLCGMIEVPLVIVIGQSPGPATGMPTRMEQGALNLALYAGTGFFPRIIFSPRSIEDGFETVQSAFNLAEKYQIPVFILTDQYFVDSYYDISTLDTTQLTVEKHFIENTEDYNRYLQTENGISPRAIPGLGSGTVEADGHTHSEDSQISEDPIVRINQVQKQLHKLDTIKQEIFPPLLIGNPNYKILIVSWGSTFPLIEEALSRLNRDDLALLSFTQVFPLHSSINEYLSQAEKTIIIEQNATGQFADLIKLETKHEFTKRILKYS